MASQDPKKDGKVKNTVAKIEKPVVPAAAPESPAAADAKATIAAARKPALTIETVAPASPTAEITSPKTKAPTASRAAHPDFVARIEAAAEPTTPKAAPASPVASPKDDAPVYGPLAEAETQAQDKSAKAASSSSRPQGTLAVIIHIAGIVLSEVASTIAEFCKALVSFIAKPFKAAASSLSNWRNKSATTAKTETPKSDIGSGSAASMSRLGDADPVQVAQASALADEAKQTVNDKQAPAAVNTEPAANNDAAPAEQSPAPGK